jgi:hypothetical protein
MWCQTQTGVASFTLPATTNDVEYYGIVTSDAAAAVRRGPDSTSAFPFGTTTVQEHMLAFNTGDNFTYYNVPSAILGYTLFQPDSFSLGAGTTVTVEFASTEMAFASGSNTVCTECPSGTYVETGSEWELNVARSQCLECEPGKFQVLAAQDHCCRCPGGKWSGAAAYSGGNSYCNDCVNGKYLMGNDDDTCVTGEGNLNTAASQCTDCACGQFLVLSGSACKTCASGHFSAGTAGLGSTACTACPVGTYHQTADLCLANTADNNPASDACPTCPNGKFAREGSTACTECSPGSYLAGTGEACVACDSDTISTASGATECSACATGQHTLTVGSSACIIIKPVLHVLGHEYLTLEQHDLGSVNYLDDSATCSDHFDGMISSSVQVSGAVVDMSRPGVYDVTYNCANSEGHVADAATRFVSVVATAAPTAAPTKAPTKAPTAAPTTGAPTKAPTAAPTPCNKPTNSVFVTAGWALVSGSSSCATETLGNGDHCVRDGEAILGEAEDCVFTYSGTGDVTRTEWALQPPASGSAGCSESGFLEVDADLRYCGISSSSNSLKFPATMSLASEGTTSFVFHTHAASTTTGFQLCTPAPAAGACAYQCSAGYEGSACTAIATAGI